MLTENELEENGRRFMLELYQQANGDPGVQISMYAIGAGLGLDKSESSRVTEPLIGNEWVEIRSLSGGVSITAQGIAVVRQVLGDSASDGSGTEKLGHAPVLDESARQAVERVVAFLKRQATEFKMDFETLAEVITDLKTIDVQMTSSRPKTSIIRACFQSIIDGLEKDDLEKSGAAKGTARIKDLLGA